ncbi:MAG TPA: HAD family phosphatase [Polyangiaceae bacterium]|nr:HAD family phosphatase [Polyangiaceae bacterium]
MLRALLFDMNGVVVDDMRFHELAWMALAARHGRTVTAEQFRRDMSGRRNRDNLRRIFGDSLSDAEARTLQLEKERTYRDSYGPHRAPLAGLVPLLDAARGPELRTALATSAPKENIDFVLDGLDLRERFDVVVGEAEVTRAKPDPEIYLTAAARLGLRPAECIAFEDSLVGVASARAAGMRVVGVTTTHTPEDLHDCALVIADFRGLTIATLAHLA